MVAELSEISQQSRPRKNNSGGIRWANDNARKLRIEPEEDSPPTVKWAERAHRKLAPPTFSHAGRFLRFQKSIPLPSEGERLVTVSDETEFQNAKQRSLQAPEQARETAVQALSQRLESRLAVRVPDPPENGWIFTVATGRIES